MKNVRDTIMKERENGEKKIVINTMQMQENYIKKNIQKNKLIFENPHHIQDIWF